MLDAHFHLNYLPFASNSRLLEEALACGVHGGVVAGVWTDDTARLASWALQRAGSSLRTGRRNAP